MRRRVSEARTAGSSYADLRRGSPALALPFAVVAGLALLTVLLPPYERPWWVPAAAAVNLVVVVVVFWAGQRRDERSWLDPLAAYLLSPSPGCSTTPRARVRVARRPG